MGSIKEKLKNSQQKKIYIYRELGVTNNKNIPLFKNNNKYNWFDRL